MSTQGRASVVAVVVPVVGVLAGVILLGGSSIQVLGFPIVFVWLFAWMPLSSLCLHLGWRMERADYDEEADS